MNANNPLEVEIQEFDRRRQELEQNFPQKFVVFHKTDFLGAWDTMNAAAEAAVARFGSGPYLIRQVGVPVPRLPASVFFRPMAPA